MFFSEGSKVQQHVLHPQQGLFVMTLVVLTFKLFAQDVAAKGLELGSTGPPNLQKKTDGWMGIGEAFCRWDDDDDDENT